MSLSKGGPAPYGTVEPPRRVTAPLPRLGHAYPWRYETVVLWNKLFGPTQRYRGLTTFIPKRRVLHEIQPRLRLAFLGDLLPSRRRRYRLGAALRDFLEDADYLSLNLEGIIGPPGRLWNAVRHEPWILDFLADLFPPQRTILLCANNHAADCGWSAFRRFYKELQDRGFRVIGQRGDACFTLPEGVLFANGTEWLNVPHPYVARLPEAADAPCDCSAEFRILCPHWGTEMSLYPAPRQIKRARRLLHNWDLIVGHHTHCPQPIVEEGGRLVAYSLGNFAWGDGKPAYWNGAALKVELGPDAAGAWRIGEARWTFVAQKPAGADQFEIDAAAACRYFPD